MPSDRPHRFFERVLVALDAGGRERTALEIAARLATLTHSELIGLFIEDTNLINLAALPFSREASPASGRFRPLDPHSMEAELRQAARDLRQELARTAERFSLSWRFQVVRGDLAHEIRMAARRTDLLVLGSQLRPFDAGQVQMFCESVTGTAACAGTVILGPRVRVTRGPLALILDSGSGDRTAMFDALSLARAEGVPLHIFALSTDKSWPHDLAQALSPAVSREEQVVIEHYPRCEDPGLLMRLQALDPGLIMIAGYPDMRAAHRCVNIVNALGTAPTLVLGPAASQPSSRRSG